MALPLAHATAGYLLHRLDPRRSAFTGRPRALTLMLVGILPDLDFLVGFALGTPGAFHRGVSHTLVAALAFGLVAGAIARWRVGDRWVPASLLFGAAYASHLVLDTLTVDARGPAGAQIFWPFSHAYVIAPITPFAEILLDGTSRAGFVATVLAWPAVTVLAREAGIAVVAVAAVSLLESWWRAPACESEPVLALASRRTEEDLA